MRHSDVLLRVAPVAAAILFVRRRAAHLTASAGIANAAVSLHPGVRRLCVRATNVAFKIWPLEPFYVEASSDRVPYRLPSSQMAIVMSKRVDQGWIAALFDRGRERGEAPVSLDGPSEPTVRPGSLAESWFDKKFISWPGVPRHWLRNTIVPAPWAGGRIPLVRRLHCPGSFAKHWTTKTRAVATRWKPLN
jgi:hypothetical protein